MSMTKQQKLGVCFGSAFGLCVLALGWFFYSAYADHQAALEGDEEEGTKGLVSAKEDNGKYYAQSNPFPSAEAIASVKSNEAAYAEWRAGALDLAARGDCPPPPAGLGGTVFKNHLYEQVTRMQKLPGGALGRICAPTFLFGFDVRAFERLQTQDDAEEENARNAKGRNKGGKGKSEKDEASAEGPKRYDFRLEFTVRASAFVKVLNGLAKSPRFYVVSDFGFEHEGESLKARLDRMSSSSASGETSSRGRRRREREKKEQEVASGFVANPETDPPILVHMKLSVYDFGKGRARADAVAAEEVPAAPADPAAPAPSKKEGK